MVYKFRIFKRELNGILPRPIERFSLPIAYTTHSFLPVKGRQQADLRYHITVILSQAEPWYRQSLARILWGGYAHRRSKHVRHLNSAAWPTIDRRGSCQPAAHRPLMYKDISEPLRGSLGVPVRPQVPPSILRIPSYVLQIFKLHTANSWRISASFTSIAAACSKSGWASWSDGFQKFTIWSISIDLTPVAWLDRWPVFSMARYTVPLQLKRS